MAAASTELRTAVIAALNAEFAADALVFADDKLSGAVATDRHRGAVYPVAERDARVAISSVNECRVQIYCQWDKEIDPEQTVSPAVVETFVDRAKRALRGVTPGSEKNWFFTVPAVDYLADPTGNVTRAELLVRSQGENVAVQETTA